MAAQTRKHAIINSFYSSASIRMTLEHERLLNWCEYKLYTWYQVGSSVGHNGDNTLDKTIHYDIPNLYL